MLMIPAIERIGNVTVFADDTEFYRFYPVADAPRLRLDETGDPIFLLLSYALSDEERAAHPDLPSGGGYLSFDTTFEPTQQELAAVQAALSPRVAAEWNRLKAGTAQEQARTGVAGTTAPPAIQLVTPTWTEGRVTMDAPKSAQLIDARVAESEPSLLAGNIASFSMDLSPAGASFMEQTLLADGDAADETPIQIAYDLRFWARLPPARIHLEVNAERMHKYIEEQFRGRNVDACTGYDYSNADIDTESLTLSGAVTVQIDTGSGSLPDEVIAELRAYAFDLTKQLVQHSFFNAEGDGADQPAPAPRRSSDGRLLVPPLKYRILGRRKLVRKDINQQTMSIKLDLEQSSVVPWTIHPRGTMQTLLPGNLAARQRHVRKLRLNDPFFATIETAIQVFADFSRLDHVEVELAYESTDENGRPHATGTVLSFADPSPQIWKAAVVGGQRDYRWRQRIVLPGGRVGPFSEWTTTHAPRVPISIESPGLIEIDVVSGSIDYEKLVRSVQVSLAYEDAAAGVPREEAVVILSEVKQAAIYSRHIDATQTRPVMAKVRFDLQSGDVIEGGDWMPIQGRQLVVNQPSEAVLDVSLLPSGNGWPDLVAVMVDLAYEDPSNAVSIHDTFTLKTLDAFATWSVYLRNRARRNYRYRWTASFTNGDLVKQDWQDNQGDPVLPIRIQRSGITVTVVADALDFTDCPLSEVTIVHDVPGGASETLVFRDTKPQTWHVEAADGAAIAFRYRVTHFPTGRDPVELPERKETDPVIVLPAYRAVSAGELRVQVIAQLVDFATTPIVAVDLNYQDPANGIDLNHSITMTVDQPMANWVVATRDARVTGFRSRTSYFLADGTQKAGEWLPSTTPRVVVPAYRPSA